MYYIRVVFSIHEEQSRLPSLRLLRFCFCFLIYQIFKSQFFQWFISHKLPLHAALQVGHGELSAGAALEVVAAEALHEALLGVAALPEMVQGEGAFVRGARLEVLGPEVHGGGHGASRTGTGTRTGTGSGTRSGPGLDRKSVV